MAPGSEIAIEARGVSKSFRVPVSGTDRSLKARLSHPFASARTREMEVLKDISFEVSKGEFFGVVGRNGSGKSTLLKLLASVYGADAGRIRIAGRLAPFLELGVGFNPQLPARDNVILNGVMMGLTPEQAKRRYETVIDFAGLRDYTELRLKNYSSGMKVRLAFAVMVQVNADVLLLDEVLAVGDSEFQQKCEAEFARMRSQGRTVVLVTHSMTSVTTYCDRALLIHDGEIEQIGDPLAIANRYLEVNIQAAAKSQRGESGFAGRWAEVMGDPPVRITDCNLHDSGGAETETISTEESIEISAELTIRRPIDGLGFQFRIDNLQGQTLLAGGPPDLGLDPETTASGSTLRVRTRIENHLAAGRYAFSCGVAQRLPDGSSEPATPVTTLPFEITGESIDGLMRPGYEVSIDRDRDSAEAK